MPSKGAEEKVKKHFEDKGYTVLNRNDVGFPDLIVLKDREVRFFVEVKSMQKPDLRAKSQLEYHQYLNKLGFEVKYLNVNQRGIKEFKIDPSWEKTVKERNVLLTK